MSEPALPVRVWFGFASSPYRSEKGRKDFLQALGQVFMPITVQMMRPLGLTAYLPAVLAPDVHPDVPDEIAVVFYESVTAYQNARSQSVGGRAYQLLHRSLFNFDEQSGLHASRSCFPELFQGTLQGNGAWTLYDASQNWQQETAMVGVFLIEGDTSNGLSLLAEKLIAIQANPPEGMRNILVATLGKCVLIWCNGSGDDSFPKDLLAITGFKILHKVLCSPVRVPLSWKSVFPGLAVQEGLAYNFIFPVRSAHEGISGA